MMRLCANTHLKMSEIVLFASLNTETGIELMRFNLDREFEQSPKTAAVLVGTLNREGPNWFFDGLGQMEDERIAKNRHRFCDIIVAQ